MKILQIASISLFASLLLIGCGDSNSYNSSSSSSSSSSDNNDGKAVEQFTSDTMQIMQRDASYLTDEDGNALYTFDKDMLNVSNCTDLSMDGNPSCLSVWPIFTAPDGSGEDLAGLPENAAHTAFRKHPLYYFTPDETTSDTKGDWVKEVWHLAYAPADAKVTPGLQLSTETKIQNYLADDRGMAVYTFDKDSENKSNCTDISTDGNPSCLSIWPIVYLDLSGTLPAGTVAGDFGEITRDDGKKQTTYKKRPIYYFTPDAQSGDTKGDWVKGVWHLAEINPAVLETIITPPVDDKVAKGRAIFTDPAKCAACHGADGQTPPLGVDNVIARYGDAELISGKLIDMRDNGNPQNRNAAMVGVAAGLSDEAIENLSAFVATLKQ